MGHEPVHTAARWEHGIVQTYRCPALCGMAPLDYFPCGSTGVVAVAGRLRAHDGGRAHSFVLSRDTAIVDGVTHELGNAEHWSPKKIEVGRNKLCTLSRVANPTAVAVAMLAANPKWAPGSGEEWPDTVKMPGPYATVLECASDQSAKSVKLATWNWEEAHMPTGYLMNTRLDLPEEEAATTGYCSTSGAPSECRDMVLNALWPEELLASLKATCGNEPKVCGANGGVQQAQQQQGQQDAQGLATFHEWLGGAASQKAPEPAQPEGLWWEKVSPTKSNRAAVLAEPVPVQVTKRAAPKAAAAPEPAATPATPAPAVSQGKWWERVGGQKPGAPRVGLANVL